MCVCVCYTAPSIHPVTCMHACSPCVPTGILEQSHAWFNWCTETCTCIQAYIRSILLLYFECMHCDCNYVCGQPLVTVTLAHTLAQTNTKWYKILNSHTYHVCSQCPKLPDMGANSGQVYGSSGDGHQIWLLLESGPRNDISGPNQHVCVITDTRHRCLRLATQSPSWAQWCRYRRWIIIHQQRNHLWTPKELHTLVSNHKQMYGSGWLGYYLQFSPDMQ